MLLSVFATSSMIMSVALALFILVVLLLAKQWYKKPQPGVALFRVGEGGSKATFDVGVFVVPIIHKVLEVDLTIKTFTLELNRNSTLQCKQSTKLETNIFFTLRVNPTQRDVFAVLNNFSAEATFDEKAIEKHFLPVFRNAVFTLSQEFTATEIKENRENVRKELFNIIGQDLYGYSLEDINIDEITVL